MANLRTLRQLDRLASPELRDAADQFIEQTRFACAYCPAQIFSALALDGNWVRLTARSHRRGTFVLIARNGQLRALELTALLPPEEWGKTAGLDQYVLHTRDCGAPARRWWLDEPQHLGRRAPSLAEINQWFRPSELQIGDRVVQAIPPEEEPSPIPTPCYVTQIGDDFIEFNGRRRRWDDRARIMVKRPFTGTALEILLHMCALQALAEAGCTCQMPLVENNLGERPMCRRCRAVAGRLKGGWRKRGRPGDPTPIIDLL